jgi:glutamate transport system substrate-binding protein
VQENDTQLSSVTVVRRVPDRLLVLTSLVLRLLVLSLIAFATGCSSSTTDALIPASAVQPAPTVANGSTLDTIRKRGTVRIGVKFDVPLFGLKDATTGELAGFDIEIANIVASAIFPDAATPESGPNTKIEFVEAISKDREKMLQRGEVDLVLSTYTITESRKQFVDFAGPYYIAGQDILARADDVANGSISGIASLNGKKVCAVTGSTSLANLREAAPKADTSITAERYPECFAALQAAKIDAMTTDDVILLGLAQQDPGVFAITGNPFHTEPYGVGIPKGDESLKQLVNGALAASFADGRWEAAFKKTIGTVNESIPTPPDLQG